MRETKGNTMYQTIKFSTAQVKESTDKLVNTPNLVKDICQDMAFLSQESFQILTLNAKNKLIERHLITLGTVNSTLVHPREIFKACILDSATSFIMIHNHPSGDTTPSHEDIKLTKRMIEAGKLMDLSPLDHIIIGRQDNKATARSFREDGIF